MFGMNLVNMGSLVWTLELGTAIYRNVITINLILDLGERKITTLSLDYFNLYVKELNRMKRKR